MRLNIVYRKNGGQDATTTTGITVTSLTGLELAHYILMRIVVEGDTVQKLVQNLMVRRSMFQL